jgi:tetratricopeptide (TPR) repeat protein
MAGTDATPRTGAPGMGQTTPEGAAALARDATARGDWTAAVVAWDAVRAADPRLAEAYAEGFDALRGAGRADDAEALAAAGLLHCPEAADLWHLHALAAYERDDPAEAARRWVEMLERFPDVPRGYQFTMLALRMAERIQEAEALAAVAVAKFEDDPGVWTEYSLLALHQGDWTEAAARADSMRSLFPDLADGYHLGILALREAGHLEEAELLGEAGLLAIPDSFEVHREHALTAARRGDLNEAAARWTAITELFPDRPESHVGAVMALREAARFNLAENRIRAADAVAQVSLTRFAEHYDVSREYALNASHGRHWDEAARRWRDLCARFPDERDPYRFGATAQRLAGDFTAARRTVAAGIARFADEPLLWIESALLAVDTGETADVVDRWRLVREHFPDHPDGYAGGVTASRAIGRFDEAETLTEDWLARCRDSEASRLFSRFEALGHNCEFGMAQRYFGAEPDTLLRWADIAPDALAPALHSEFAGIDDAAATDVRLVDDDRYVIINDTIGVRIHTFVSKWDVSEQQLLDAWLPRLRFLREKLLTGLRTGSRIFVHQTPDGRIADTTLATLHAAVRRHGPAPLLCVTTARELAADGTVEQLAGGLMIGHIASLSPEVRTGQIMFESWSRICEAAAARIDPR